MTFVDLLLHAAVYLEEINRFTITIYDLVETDLRNTILKCIFKFTCYCNEFIPFVYKMLVQVKIKCWIKQHFRNTLAS